jgi:hypothetical protein
VWCTTYFTHWPWFWNDGESKFRQPPFLQSAFVDGVAVGAGTWAWPLTLTFVRSAVPCTSIRTLTDLIVPVGNGT